MSGITYNTLLDPAPGVDFIASPTEGSNRLVTQFTLFETETANWQNSLTSDDIVYNTLED